MNTILVQMADPQWTQEALHLACSMARDTHSSIALLQLMQVQHYAWLGTPFGCEMLSAEDCDQLWNYKEIAEAYGVDLSLQPMQYVSYVGAMVDACEQLGSEIVFAQMPPSRLAWLRRIETWNLRRQLTQTGRALYTLDEPAHAMQVGALKPQSSSLSPQS